MESNKTMLTPFMCEACVFRQRKRTSRRKLAYCLFIAYNAIILSVISATLWYINGRLNRTEGAIAVLKEQSKTSEDHIPVEFSPLATKTDTDEELLRDIKSENLTRSLSTRVNRMLRRKRSQPKKKRKKRCKANEKRSREKRTASSQVPHFYLRGHDTQRALNGIFAWKRPSARSFSRHDDFFDATLAGNSITKVKILRSGVYFVFAKITVNGRSPLESRVRPPVGIYLKKNNEELDTAWTTQDNRGGIYNVLRIHASSDDMKYPMDSLSVSGLHKLAVNDEIYVQKPPDSLNSHDERFLIEDTKAGFGAFLVEAECLTC